MLINLCLNWRFPSEKVKLQQQKFSFRIQFIKYETTFHFWLHFWKVTLKITKKEIQYLCISIIDLLFLYFMLTKT